MDPKTFGRYQIVRKLAGGGMGRVYLAYDPTLNRQVGLKLIDAGSDQDSIDLITAERRGALLQDQLAKREQSGRVAQIFDVGEREGYFYIAMEYIEGEDLSELIARGPLPPARAVSIALDVLDVLVRAHSFQTMVGEKLHRGIIHGDIKPRNIRMTTAGQVKVLDFGIAKAVSMTRSITFNQFGSVPYSSPERLQTGDMDARSDVWAMAVVLYEMLAGRPYFEAPLTSKLEWMIRNYRALQPGVASLPAGLREVLSRALDPDPERRFPSAALFEAALHNWRPDSKQEAPAASPVLDPDATRRTTYQAPKPVSTSPALTGATLRTPARARSSALVTSVYALRSLVRFLLPRSPRLLQTFRAGIAAAVIIFFAGIFTMVYEIRMWNNAEALRHQIESGRVTPEVANTAYQALARRSLFNWPLYPARGSLRERYIAEADRVIADYREASESTPVYLKDWRRAQTALNAALALAPGDRQIRGKLSLVAAHLLLRNGDIKGARSGFEQARSLLGSSPDPHLGLALIFMNEGEIDKAEAELTDAAHSGFKAGRREQKSLADGYRVRGERWLSSASRIHDMGKMEEALRHADSDLAHAQDLYNSVAPFLNGVALAEKVSLERDRAAKSLALAHRARQENP